MSLMRSTNGPQVGVADRRVTEHGIDLDALELVEVHARARRRAMALITSPCETTDVASASAPGSRAFQSRTAATARADMSAIDSPSAPGKTAALGCCLHHLPQRLLDQVFSGWPVQSP